jgi:hypothetical protein
MPFKSETSFPKNNSSKGSNTGNTKFYFLFPSKAVTSFWTTLEENFLKVVFKTNLNIGFTFNYYKNINKCVLKFNDNFC